MLDPSEKVVITVKTHQDVDKIITGTARCNLVVFIIMQIVSCFSLMGNIALAAPHFSSLMVRTHSR